MRWDNLFDDLESQLEGGLRADEADLVIEEERLRLARLSLRERLLALTRGETATSVRLLLASGRVVDVVPLTVGRDWLAGQLVREGGGGASPHTIVPFAGLQGIVLSRQQITGSAAASAEHAVGEGLSARLGLGYVLRDLCRRRTAVYVDLAGGASVHGTVDRVGRDHLDLAVHDVGLPRRESAVSHYRVIPVHSIEQVRTG